MDINSLGESLNVYPREYDEGSSKVFLNNCSPYKISFDISKCELNNIHIENSSSCEIINRMRGERSPRSPNRRLLNFDDIDFSRLEDLRTNSNGEMMLVKESNWNIFSSKTINGNVHLTDVVEVESNLEKSNPYANNKDKTLGNTVTSKSLLKIPCLENELLNSEIVENDITKKQLPLQSQTPNQVGPMQSGINFSPKTIPLEESDDCEDQSHNARPHRLNTQWDAYNSQLEMSDSHIFCEGDDRSSASVRQQQKFHSVSSNQKTKKSLSQTSLKSKCKKSLSQTSLKSLVKDYDHSSKKEPDIFKSQQFQNPKSITTDNFDEYKITQEMTNRRLSEHDNSANKELKGSVDLGEANGVDPMKKGTKQQQLKLTVFDKDFNKAKPPNIENGINIDDAHSKNQNTRNLNHNLKYSTQNELEKNMINSNNTIIRSFKLAKQPNSTEDNDQKIGNIRLLNQTDNDLKDKINLMKERKRRGGKIAVIEMAPQEVLNSFGVVVFQYKSGNKLYEGEVDDNKKYHGSGVKFYDNIIQKISYNGEWKNGQRHGKGIELYMNQCKKYDGDWANNKANGFGVLCSQKNEVKIYEGNWKDGAQNGIGICYYNTGVRKYEGNWVHGKRNGKGISYDQSGNKRYEGQWKDDKCDGKGIAYDNSGQQIYIGDWVNKKAEGNGMAFDSNGATIYLGLWKENKWHGKGDEYYKSGKKKYSGNWNMDKREGFGISYYKNECKEYECEWHYGRKSGFGIWYYINGNKYYEGNFLRDKRSGIGMRFDQQENLKYKGEWHKDVQSGNGTKYHSNGLVMFEGYWENNLANGKGCGYDKKGRKRYKSMWKDGMCDGIGVEFNKNDSIKYIGMYSGGYRDGEGSLYRSNGERCSKGIWKGNYLIHPNNEKIDEKMNKLELKIKLVFDIA